jgi:hypothetical protein
VPNKHRLSRSRDINKKATEIAFMKQCLKCNENKNVEEFYKDKSKKDNLTIYCKDCCKSKERAYYLSDPHKKYFRTRKSKFKNGTGAEPLTRGERETMLLAQDKRCGICSSVMVKPCLDHNHNTMKTRMLLCSWCNTLIGMAREDVTILSNAIKYIEKFNAS